MQKIFLFILLLSLFACKNKSELKESTWLHSNSQKQTIQPNYLFGKWVMCSANFNGVGLSYNVCPIINFNALDGEYIYQSETFLYKADYLLSKLQIINKSKASNIISNGSYQIIFSNNGTALILRELRKDNISSEYYLNRASD